MKIDRMFYEKFEDTVRENDFIAVIIYLTHRRPRIGTKPRENARQPLPQSLRAEAKTS